MHEREPATLVEFLAPYPETVRELTLDSRMLLLDLLYPTNEIFYDAISAVCSGFVYTEKVRDSFVNLAVYSDHVTLIFQYGVNLTDPESRLKGSGNQVRHIRLTGLETLQDPYVVDLIRQSSENATRPTEPMKPVQIVKEMNGPKRRPKAQV